MCLKNQFSEIVIGYSLQNDFSYLKRNQVCKEKKVYNRVKELIYHPPFTVLSGLSTDFLTLSRMFSE